jgi:molybdopterin molybdotransferase
MAALLTIAEALEQVLARVVPLPAEAVQVEEACGRVLAEDARTRVDLPPFDSSAMDGYAVRAADTPGTLPVVFRIAAGRPAPRALQPGETMAIATGGVVPPGADAVIPIEYVVHCDNHTVEFPEPARPGANVRRRGGDLRVDQAVVTASTLLAPAHVGALAAAGLDQVRCARRPRAAVLTTGTELRRPGEPLGVGEVYEANGPLLGAQLASAGASVERLPSAVDEEEAHRAAISSGLEADILVTSGGVSVGPHDLVRRVEAELGVEEVFWGVAVKPGKPISFGVRDGTLVFGLPGNPVSSLVGFELFVRPAVLGLQGVADPRPQFEGGRLAASVSRNRGRDQLLRARSRAGDQGTLLEPLAGQESHMIARAAEADALVLVPRGEGQLERGAPVRYLRLV